MKTKRFDFNWRPLRLQVSFAVDGSVPDKQNYNDDTLEYTPDYSITPLILQPNVSIIDKDEVLPAGRVNQRLANVRWYEIVNGRKEIITTDNASFEITTKGANAGRILVKKNAEPKVPLCLEFYAEFTDTRNNQLSTIQGSYTIRCGSASDSIRIETDAAEQTLYNPLLDTRLQTITATVWVADRICDPKKYALLWEILGADGTWHGIGDDTTLDYHVTKPSSNKLRVDRWLMGQEMYIRVRCIYSASGDLTGLQYTEASPSAQVAIVRRIPRYEYDMTGAPVNIPSGLRTVAPSAIVRTTNGEIVKAEKELLPRWYIATNKASGSLTYSQVADGYTPTIPTEKMDKIYGAVIGLDVEDRGYAGALMDNRDGKVICDSDGKLLIIH